MKRIGRRILISLLIFYIVITAMFISDGVGAYMTNKGKDPIEFTELTIDDAEKNRAVYGECYVVYDLIGYEYPEDKEDAFENADTCYWLVDCGDDVMLVKTNGGSLADEMNEFAELYTSTSSWLDYYDKVGDPVVLDGIFVKNDSDMVDFYNEWVEIKKEASYTWNSVELAPYTLDCTQSYDSRIAGFYIGGVMLILGVGAVILAIFLIMKASKRGPAMQMAGAPAGNYGNLQGGSYDSFNTQGAAFGGAAGGAYQPQNGSAYTPQNGSAYQPQNGSAYAPQNGSAYQPQNGSAYAPQNGSAYQPQNGSAYAPQNGSAYQPQNGSAYAPQNGSAYQPQNGSAYAPQNGSAYQPQNSSASTPQSTSAYGSSGGTYNPGNTPFVSQNSFIKDNNSASLDQATVYAGEDSYK